MCATKCNFQDFKSLFPVTFCFIHMCLTSKLNLYNWLRKETHSCWKRADCVRSFHRLHLLNGSFKEALSSLTLFTFFGSVLPLSLQGPGKVSVKAGNPKIQPILRPFVRIEADFSEGKKRVKTEGEMQKERKTLSQINNTTLTSPGTGADVPITFLYFPSLLDHKWQHSGIHQLQYFPSPWENRRSRLNHLLVYSAAVFCLLDEEPWPAAKPNLSIKPALKSSNSSILQQNNLVSLHQM